MKRILAAVAAFALSACGGEDSALPASGPAADQHGNDADAMEQDAPLRAELNAIAEAFVKLGLEIGVYDADFVDAYHGPAEWRQAAQAAPRSPEALQALAEKADRLIDAIDQLPGADNNARAVMLRRQLIAAKTRIRMAMGESLPFDEETRLLYDAVAPDYQLAEFDAALETIDAITPGEGPLHERVDAFRQRLAIPADKLATVFDAAMAECRRRTAEHFELPADENFTIGYVTDKPWSGYNWYKGDATSLIEVNTDFPVIIDRAVDLGCHEGYPGHHVWNVLVERDFLNANGWIEYSIYPLFSPQSLIGEGTANYGIELAFPGEEKTRFEREVLFPLAGLDPALADKLDALNKARRQLSHARNHIAREYLDGRMDRETAIETTMKYSLVSRDRAEQSVRFVETYRGYVLNYNLGRDLVADYVERRVAAGGDRWSVFKELLTTPVSASDLTTDIPEARGGGTP